MFHHTQRLTQLIIDTYPNRRMMNWGWGMGDWAWGMGRQGDKETRRW
ncbi:MAG: hypothetical protein WBA39_18900 [Rivularia sp. (in: cyanobacteria)]